MNIDIDPHNSITKKARDLCSQFANTGTDAKLMSPHQKIIIALNLFSQSMTINKSQLAETGLELRDLVAASLQLSSRDCQLKYLDLGDSYIFYINSPELEKLDGLRSNLANASSVLKSAAEFYFIEIARNGIATDVDLATRISFDELEQVRIAAYAMGSPLTFKNPEYKKIAKAYREIKQSFENLPLLDYVCRSLVTNGIVTKFGMELLLGEGSQNQIVRLISALQDSGLDIAPLKGLGYFLISLHGEKSRKEIRTEFSQIFGREVEEYLRPEGNIPVFLGELDGIRVERIDLGEYKYLVGGYQIRLLKFCMDPAKYIVMPQEAASTLEALLASRYVDVTTFSVDGEMMDRTSLTARINSINEYLEGIGWGKNRLKFKNGGYDIDENARQSLLEKSLDEPIQSFFSEKYNSEIAYYSPKLRTVNTPDGRGCVVYKITSSDSKDVIVESIPLDEEQLNLILEVSSDLNTFVKILGFFKKITAETTASFLRIFVSLNRYKLYSWYRAEKEGFNEDLLSSYMVELNKIGFPLTTIRGLGYGIGTQDRQFYVEQYAAELVDEINHSEIEYGIVQMAEVDDIRISEIVIAKSEEHQMLNDMKLVKFEIANTVAYLVLRETEFRLLNTLCENNFYIDKQLWIALGFGETRGSLSKYIKDLNSKLKTAGLFTVDAITPEITGYGFLGYGRNHFLAEKLKHNSEIFHFNGWKFEIFDVGSYLKDHPNSFLPTQEGQNRSGILVRIDDKSMIELVPRVSWMLQIFLRTDRSVLKIADVISGTEDRHYSERYAFWNAFITFVKLLQELKLINPNIDPESFIEVKELKTSAVFHFPSKAEL